MEELDGLLCAKSGNDVSKIMQDIDLKSSDTVSSPGAGFCLCQRNVALFLLNTNLLVAS